MTTKPSTHTSGQLAAIWGVCGFSLLLIVAMERLGAMTVEAFDYPLGPLHWGALFANLLFMAYSEGYRGFQKSYSPRLAARAHYLANNHVGALHVVLAPFFCMGFYCAPRRRIISAILLTLMIIGFILVFQKIPQPWRGILDAGVVLGLGWGLTATGWSLWNEFCGNEQHVDPEVTC